MLSLLTGAFTAFFILLFSGMWVGVAAAVVGMGVLWITTGWDNMVLASTWVVWLSVNSYVLTTVPLFIFMGIILSESGLGDRMYNALAPTFNHFPGGLLYTNIIAGALFAMISGSISAAAATIGTVSFREMDKRGYPPDLSAGCIGAASILSPLIPPSMLMIFYAAVTEQSVGKLFLAGVIPGFILAAMFIAYIALRFKFFERWEEIRGELLPWKTCLARTKDIWLIVVLIISVLGSIFTGIATPTEGAGVGCFGSLVLAGLHRKLNWALVKKAVFDTVKINCPLMFVLIGINIMSAALSRAGLISTTTKALLSLPVPPLVVLILVYVIFFILGIPIDGIPLLLMTVPVVYPTVVALGYDPVWFGVMVVMLCIVGNLSPPVGVTLFVLQLLRPGRPVTEIYWGLLPFGIIILIALTLFTAFPELSLFLPRIMMGG